MGPFIDGSYPLLSSHLLDRPCSLRLQARVTELEGIKDIRQFWTGVFCCQGPFFRARVFVTHVCFCRTTVQAKQQDTRFLFFFSISVGQPPLPVWPTRPISLTQTQTLLPQLTAWSQFTAGEPKRTKKRTKGEGRSVIVSLGFHRVRCLGGGSTQLPMCDK